MPDPEETLLDDEVGDILVKYGEASATDALLGRILVVLANQGIDVERLVEDVRNIASPPTETSNAKIDEATRATRDGVTLKLESILECFDSFRSRGQDTT